MGTLSDNKEGGASCVIFEENMCTCSSDPDDLRSLARNGWILTSSRYACADPRRHHGIMMVCNIYRTSHVRIVHQSLCAAVAHMSHL
jgi:hypothetical protein